MTKEEEYTLTQHHEAEEARSPTEDYEAEEEEYDPTQHNKVEEGCDPT